MQHSAIDVSHAILIAPLVPFSLKDVPLALRELDYSVLNVLACSQYKQHLNLTSLMLLSLKTQSHNHSVKQCPANVE